MLADDVQAAGDGLGAPLNGLLARWSDSVARAGEAREEVGGFVRRRGGMTARRGCSHHLKRGGNARPGDRASRLGRAANWAIAEGDKTRGQPRGRRVRREVRAAGREPLPGSGRLGGGDAALGGAAVRPAGEAGGLGGRDRRPGRGIGPAVEEKPRL
jgi:hypothetical protein